MTAAQPISPSTPKALGPYHVLGVLGQGGMGVVYRAQHAKTGTQVALKTVLGLSEGSLTGIRREIHALARIRHPGIVRIVDHGVATGLPWYAMDLLEGETLRDRLQRLRVPTHASQPGAVGPLTKTQPQNTIPLGDPSAVNATSSAKQMLDEQALKPLLSLVHRLCAPLAFLHGEGLVHRDLKPDNVVILHDGQPVLVDFGIAATFSGPTGRENLGVEGQAVGSAAYMSPEQIRGEIVDARADLYALGCILYECITGSPPFTGSVHSLIFQQLSDLPLPPSSRMDGVPSELDRLILRLLEKRPQDRIGYADDVALALHQWADAGSPHAAPRGRAYLYRPELEGRASILDQIDGHLSSLASRDLGAFVLLGGESGVGKTRFAIEIARRAVQADITVVAGQCLPMSAAPLHPFRPLLLALADHCRAKGSGATQRLLGQNGKILANYEPAMVDLPGFCDQPDPPALPPDLARQRVLETLIATLLAYAKDKPLLLVLDDLQWADELSLDALKQLLAGDFADQGLLVLGTYRMEELEGPLVDLVDDNKVMNITLDRLDRSSVGAMVSGMLALQKPPSHLIDFLHDQSDGNPFFIAEYLRAAIGERLLTRDPSGHWRLRDVTGADILATSVPLPTTLADLIDRRLGALGQHNRVLVDWASVLGREFDASLLSTTAMVSDAAMIEALEVLHIRQVIEDAGPGRLRFVHDKIREIAYDRIDLNRRRTLHQGAGLAMEACYPGVADVFADLGHHFAQAAVHDKAGLYLGKAADRARSVYANGEAIRLYRAAIAEVGRVADQRNTLPQLHEHLGDVLTLVARQQEAIDAFEQSLAYIASSDGLGRARLYHKSAFACELLQHYDDALRFHDKAEASLQALSQDEAYWQEWVDIQLDRISVHYWLGRVDRMGDLVAVARPLVEQHGTLVQQSNFFHALTQFNVRLERYRTSAETVSHARAALSAADADADPSRFAEFRFSLAVVLLFHGALDEAENQILAALAEAEKIGDMTVQSRCLTYLGMLYRTQGRVEAVAALADKSLATAEAVHIPQYVGAALGNQAWIAWRRGDRGKALAMSERAVACWEGLDHVFPFQWVARFPLAAAKLAEGQLDEAVTLVGPVVEPNQQRLQDAMDEAVKGALTAFQRGDLDEARERITSVMEAAGPFGYL